EFGEGLRHANPGDQENPSASAPQRPMNSQPELEKSVRTSIRIPTAAATKPPATGRMNVSRSLHTSHHRLFNFASQEFRKEKRSNYSAPFSGKRKAQNGAYAAAVQRPRNEEDW